MIIIQVIDSNSMTGGNDKFKGVLSTDLDTVSIFLTGLISLAELVQLLIVNVVGISQTRTFRIDLTFFSSI